MTEWTLLKRLLDSVHQHSTLIGRIWLTVMAVFRLLVVAVAAEDVYEDERAMFVCDSLQPGCANVCYDAFSPISQPRFWVFHIVVVSTPSLFFILYTWHNLSKTVPAGNARIPFEEHGRTCNSDSCSIASHHHLGRSLDVVLDKSVLTHTTVVPKHKGHPSGVLSKAYVLHVCFRAALELAFLSVQWLLFGFRVPVRYTCAVPPCPQKVDCYVSRPTEKSIFLIFMFCVGVFCILLNFLELNHLGWKKIRRSVQVKESWRSDCFYSRNGKSNETNSTHSLPVLDLLMEDRSDWTYTGNQFCSSLKNDTGKMLREMEKATQTPREKQSSHKGRVSKKTSEVWI